MADKSVKKKEKKLLVIAPEVMRKSINEVFTSLYTDVFIQTISKSVGTGKDPFGIEYQIKNCPVQPDAVLLVAPPNRSPARLIPYPLLNGVPVGIVQPKSETELIIWLDTLINNSKPVKSVLWAILSMSKRDYLEGAEKMLNGLRSSNHCNGISVKNWFADTTYREDLCKNLAKGPNLTIYFGHARPRGWSGYRAVRWPHIIAEELQRPCDVLISISCSTLKKQHQRPSFGIKWINEGRACAFVGNVNSVKTDDNDKMSNLMLEIFKNEKIEDIGQLLQSVEKRLDHSPMESEIRRAFKTYRILGNPLQGIR